MRRPDRLPGSAGPRPAPAGEQPYELPKPPRVAGAVATEEEAMVVGQMAVLLAWATRAQETAGKAGRRVWGALQGPGRAPRRKP